MTLQEFKDNQLKSFSQLGGDININRPLLSYMWLLDLTEQHIQELGGKKLLLVGGGASPIQKAFKREGIKCNVTNVDAYINDPKSAKTIYNQDFVDVDFVNAFDECWAVYSLPLYSPDNYHAACFYARAALALKPGGALRVCGLPQYVKGKLSAGHLPRTKLSLDKLKCHLKELFETGVDGIGTPTVCSNILFEILKSRNIDNEELTLYEYWIAPQSESDKEKLNKHLQTKYKEFMRKHKRYAIHHTY